MVLSTDVLADLAFRSTIDGFRDIARSLRGGLVHEEDGVLIWLSPHPFPFLVNGAYRTDPNVEAKQALSSAKDFFGGRGRGFSFYGRVGVDDDIMTAAEEVGMIGMGDPAPVMAIGEPPETVSVPDGVQIGPVETAEQVGEFADVCADAYAVYGMPPDLFPAIVQPSVLLGPYRAAVLARDDQGPMGAGAVIASHGTAYVSIIGTCQRAFRRGVGAAVTQSVTKMGFDLGARVATLMASPMGAPVYRRIGWSDVGHMASRVAFP
jgi:hypothetical protein